MNTWKIKYIVLLLEQLEGRDSFFPKMNKEKFFEELNRKYGFEVLSGNITAEKN